MRFPEKRSPFGYTLSNHLLGVVNDDVDQSLDGDFVVERRDDRQDLTEYKSIVGTIRSTNKSTNWL